MPLILISPHSSKWARLLQQFLERDAQLGARSATPAHMCGPRPNARCCRMFGRRNRNVFGSGNTVSSRLADAYTSAIAWPGWMCRPCSVTACRAERAKPPGKACTAAGTLQPRRARAKGPAATAAAAEASRDRCTAMLPSRIGGATSPTTRTCRTQPASSTSGKGLPSLSRAAMSELVGSTFGSRGSRRRSAITSAAIAASCAAATATLFLSKRLPGFHVGLRRSPQHLGLRIRQAEPFTEHARRQRAREMLDEIRFAPLDRATASTCWRCRA